MDEVGGKLSQQVQAAEGPRQVQALGRFYSLALIMTSLSLPALSDISVPPYVVGALAVVGGVTIAKYAAIPVLKNIVPFGKLTLPLLLVPRPAPSCPSFFLQLFCKGLYT